MSNLCKYKHFFGVPKKGIHAVRLFNIAIIDVILTIMGAKLIQMGLNKLNNNNKLLDTIDNVFHHWNYFT